MALGFEWDPRKAAANLRKHGVSFPEAATAFDEPLSLTIPDPDHSAAKERFLLLGLTARTHLVVVAHIWSAAPIFGSSPPDSLTATSAATMKLARRKSTNRPAAHRAPRGHEMRPSYDFRGGVRSK